MAAALAARKGTGCYRYVLVDLGAQLPKAERSAMEALDDPDPELVGDAVEALGRWGSAGAEKALWGRLERTHKEWDGRQDQLRSTPDFQSPGVRGAALEQGLVSAIAESPNWLCPPGQVSPPVSLTRQEAVFERVRAAAERHGIALGKTNHP